jgi:hypothetical protein
MRVITDDLRANTQTLQPFAVNIKTEIIEKSYEKSIGGNLVV